MYDFYVEMNQSTENLASIGEMLGAGGVNLFGLSLTRSGRRDHIHFAVEDAGAAEQRAHPGANLA